MLAPPPVYPFALISPDRYKGSRPARRPVMEVLNPLPPRSPPRTRVLPNHPLSHPIHRAPSSPISLVERRSSGSDLTTNLVLPVESVVNVNGEISNTPLPSTLATRPGRRTSVSARTFHPLTPIIASPLVTPSQSASSNDIFLSFDTDESDSEEELDKSKVTDTIVALPGKAQNFLSNGNLVTSPLADTSSRNQATPTWTSTPPTPPPKPLIRSVSSGARRSSSSLIPSASLPTSLLPHGRRRSAEFSKRRASLPPMSLSKPLPPTPPPPPSSALKNHALNLRRLSQLNGSPLRLVVVTSPGETSDSDVFGEHPRRDGNENIRAKPLFHIVQDSSDKEEDIQTYSEHARRNGSQDDRCTDEGITLEGTSTSGNSDETRQRQKQKDDTRRYYALLELLTTEMGYLMDLRTLVSIYIRHLPTLTAQSFPPSHLGSSSNISISPFTRTSSSTFLSTTFTPGSCSSYMQLRVSPSPASPTDSQGGSQSPVTKDKEKHAPRYLFSDNEIDIVTRNIEQILQFHEVFVEELRKAVEPFGFSSLFDESELGGDVHSPQWTGMGSSFDGIDAVVSVVAKQFASEASRFNIYQAFCAGHPEAFDLVRKIQKQHPADWETFERHSSSLASARSNARDEALVSPPLSPSGTDDPTSLSDVPSAMPESESFDKRRKRRHSLSSLDIPVRPRMQQAKSNTNIKWAKDCPSEQSHSANKSKDQLSRLVFMDYLIKPVQRICKYPLLLDQLKDSKVARSRTFREGSHEPSSTSADLYLGRSSAKFSVADDASRAMREVASSVDEARRRQDIATKSSLIVSRISQSAAQSSGHSSSGSQATYNLTPNFMSSLGACLLSGSLDVTHHDPHKDSGSSHTVKAKYLGAFLYVGGYFVLVKVLKGKVYEPRHWFSLVDFDIVDVDEDDALLPCSFRLSHKGHYFELAAACQREKDLWISAIHESLTLPASWSNEPISSLQLDSTGESMAASPVDGPSDTASSLTTIRSIPEVERRGDYDGVSVRHIDLSGGDSRVHRTLPRRDRSVREPPPSAFPHSRRSSTASVKAIFGPSSSDAATFLIRRSTPPARVQVERGLLDVFSELCLSARFHAHTHDEELFQAPKVHSGFSRSNSGLAMAGAMGVAAKNRLTKHESVLVTKRKSFVDGNGLSGDLIFGEASQKSLPRVKTFATRIQTKKVLRIAPVPIIVRAEDDDARGATILPQTAEPMPDSPTPLSRCSSMTASNPSSAVASPVIDIIVLPSQVPATNGLTPNPELLDVREGDYRPKRARSMVDNVRGFFYTRSSPSISLLGSEQQSNGLSPSLRKWWSKGSLRRRVRSAPDVPGEELPPFTSRLGSGSPTSPSSGQNSLAPTPEHHSQRPSALLTDFEEADFSRSDGAGLDPSPQPEYCNTPSRRRSLLSSASLRRLAKCDHSESETPSRRLQRNASLLQRLSPLSRTARDSS